MGLLGEFLALGVSLEHLAKSFNNSKALILAKTLTKRLKNSLWKIDHL